MAPTPSNPMPHSQNDSFHPIVVDPLIDQPDVDPGNNGPGYQDDEVTINYAPATIIGADDDDPAVGMPAVGDVPFKDVILVDADELPDQGL